jgi:uncharacterized MAPEG superfamily protein
VNPSFTSIKVLAVCCVILFIKMLWVGVVQTLTRAKTGEFTNPIDAKFFAKREPVEKDPVMVERGANAFRNDLENIPMFLFLGLMYSLLGCWELGALIYFSIFTVTRINHSISYLKGLQPWRTVSYSIGAAVSIVVCAHILYQVFFHVGNTITQ